MRWVPTTAMLVLAAGCADLSGLENFEFVEGSSGGAGGTGGTACVPDAAETTCATVACGTAFNNCGDPVECPDTCPGVSACGIANAGPNECGCTGPGTVIPEAPTNCTRVDSPSGRPYYRCTPESFDTARDICRSAGLDLVIINDITENNFIRSLTVQKMLIGLYDPQECAAPDNNPCTFEWVDGTGVTFQSFTPGEPNNTGGGEHCVEIDPSTGGWNDIPCVNNQTFVCEVTCPAE